MCVCMYVLTKLFESVCMHVYITLGDGSGSKVCSVSMSVYIYSSLEAVDLGGLLSA